VAALLLALCARLADWTLALDEALGANPSV
jgi:hypothetical protein